MTIAALGGALLALFGPTDPLGLGPRPLPSIAAGADLEQDNTMTMGYEAVQSFLRSFCAIM